MIARDGENPRVARFATVILDVDSTLSAVEGVDWLAARRGPAVAAQVHRLTDDAMNGRLALEDVYARRLEQIAPSRDDVHALADEYRATVAHGAHATIARMKEGGIRVVAVSGGVHEAIVPLCRELSLEERDIFAVSLMWNAGGEYAGFDRSSPLATQRGKPEIVRALALPHPILAVGDGSTDAAIKTGNAADAFAAYTGFVRREPVVAVADFVIDSFASLLTLVFTDAA